MSAFVGERRGERNWRPRRGEPRLVARSPVKTARVALQRLNAEGMSYVRQPNQREAPVGSGAAGAALDGEFEEGPVRQRYRSCRGPYGRPGLSRNLQWR